MKSFHSHSTDLVFHLQMLSYSWKLFLAGKNRFVNSITHYFAAPEKNPVDVKGEGNETNNMVITWKVRRPLG